MDKIDDEEKIVHFKLQLHSAHSQHSVQYRLVQRFGEYKWKYIDLASSKLTNWENARRKFDSICSKIYYVQQLH